MVFRFYVKLTASRKTEQSDRKTKNIPQIQGFRMRYSKSNSSLPGLTITESLWRTSRVYHVMFPHIQLELNGKTVQFIGRDCIYWVLFVSQILSIAINQVCFHLLCCNLSLQSLHDVTNNNIIVIHVDHCCSGDFTLFHFHRFCFSILFP